MVPHGLPGSLLLRLAAPAIHRPLTNRRYKSISIRGVHQCPFSSCMVCVCEHGVFFENNLLRSALRTAGILPALLCRCIFVLAWCPLADMAPTSKITRARLQLLRTEGILIPGVSPASSRQWELRCSWQLLRTSGSSKQSGRDVGILMHAVQDSAPHCCSECSLPCSPPARSGRGLDSHACVVCVYAHRAYSGLGR